MFEFSACIWKGPDNWCLWEILAAVSLWWVLQFGWQVIVLQALGSSWTGIVPLGSSQCGIGSSGTLHCFLNSPVTLWTLFLPLSCLSLTLYLCLLWSQNPSLSLIPPSLCLMGMCLVIHEFASLCVPKQSGSHGPVVGSEDFPMIDSSLY